LKQKVNPSQSSTAILSVRGLSTQLGDPEKPVKAVDDLSFDLYPGKTLALLGESGCGKSMTALSIMRLLPAGGVINAGDVNLHDQDLLELTEADMRFIRGSRVGMIFQEPMTSLNPVMTVGDQIAESVRLHDQDVKGRAQVKSRIIELLKDVGIPDPELRFGEYPHQLSGGMKQRVMIAIALAGKPDVLIADEPTTALDVTIQAQVLSLLKSLQVKRNMAILLITHDLGVVAEVADHIAVMYAGQIIETAPVKDFFARPKHPYSQKLFESLPSRHKRGNRLAMIDGQVPPLTTNFIQCRFIDRCNQKQSICEQGVPNWNGTLAEGYRCYLENIASSDNDINESVDTNLNEHIDAEFLLRLDQLKVHFPIKKGLFKKTVGHIKAVDGINLDISRGRTVALVGESGCGKTTAGKALLQLVKPTAGSVTFDSLELTQLNGSELRKKRSDLQIIFQDPVSSMNPRMIVEDIIAEGLVAQKIGANRQERFKLVLDLLDKVGLPESAAQRYPHEFSGGQRQRICIARALAVNPDLIVCDEPTSALDVSVQAQILNLLKDLQDKFQISYLFISHDISVVSYLAHEIAVMYLGKIVERGKLEEVLDNPTHPYTRSLLNAVPVPNPSIQRKMITLEGDMPSPANPPSGCHFHPRCPISIDECQKVYPTEVELSNTHQVACIKAKAAQ